MDSKSKRNRVQNFDANEIDILVELVERRKHIIECKKTDAITSKIKDTEWEKLAVTFNAQSNVLRTSLQLRNKWDSLKKVTKKDYSDEKLNLYKTGGGKASNKIKAPWAERVLSIIKIGAMGFNSNFDCDDEVDITEKEHDIIQIADIEESTPVILEKALEDTEIQIDWTKEVLRKSPKKSSSNQINQPIINLYQPNISQSSEKSMNEEGFEDTETQVDWSSWTPETLRKPTHPSLKTSSIQISDPPIKNSFNSIKSENKIATPSTSKICPPRKKAKRSLAASTNQNFSDLALKKLELVKLQLKHEEELFELKKEALQTEIALNKKKLNLL